MEAFLAGRIGFLEIAELVEQTIARAAADSMPAEPDSVEAAIALDAEGRRIARELADARRAR